MTDKPEVLPWMKSAFMEIKHVVSDETRESINKHQEKGWIITAIATHYHCYIAAYAPESVTVDKLREIWNKCRSDKEVIAAIYALIYPDDATHAPSVHDVFRTRG